MAHDSALPPVPPGPLGWPAPPAGVLDGLVATVPWALVVTDAAGRVTWANDAFSALTGYGAWDVAGRSLAGLLRFSTTDDVPSLEVGDALAEGRPFATTVVLHRKDGQTRWVDLRLLTAPPSAPPEAMAIGVLVDATERVQTATRLAQSERLATIGTLAAGVAHEIASPVQFVGDSVQFLRGALADMTGVIAALQRVRDAVAAGAPAGDLVAAARTAEDDADIAYVLEHAPRAVDACAEGLDRVSRIVRSLKEFSHPQQGATASVDLNHVIDGTLTLARNEFKYVADLETAFGELPPVTCVAGSISQVILNLVVNAAHAVRDAVEGSGRKGHIVVTTAADGDHAVITVQDSGVGIPDAIRPHIFEPFFTTKSVGQGTGQGLALVWDVVTRAHGGTVDVESVPGAGATFRIRLPIAGAAVAAAAREAA
ncbi:MAG: ATP-binding protein [Candidatus Binatia bacterium]